MPQHLNNQQIHRRQWTIVLQNVKVACDRTNFKSFYILFVPEVSGELALSFAPIIPQLLLNICYAYLFSSFLCIHFYSNNSKSTTAVKKKVMLNYSVGSLDGRNDASECSDKRKIQIRSLCSKKCNWFKFCTRCA